MRIKIQNLGYVNEADIDLGKDLIVLCGPNNTGKTYVAYTIYGLMYYGTRPTLNTGSLDIASPEQKINIDLLKLLSDNRHHLATAITKTLKKYLPDVFASEKALFDKTHLHLELHQKDIDLAGEMITEQEIKNITVFNDIINFSLNKPKGSISLSYLISSTKEPKNVDISHPFINDMLSRDVWRIILNKLFAGVYFAPAERIAVSIFSKELSVKRNQLVDELLELKERRKSENPFDLLTRRAIHLFTDYLVKTAQRLLQFQYEGLPIEYRGLILMNGPQAKGQSKPINLDYQEDSLTHLKYRCLKAQRQLNLDSLTH